MYPLREQKIFGRQAGGAGGGRLKAVMGRNRGRRDKGGGGGAALKVQGVSKSYGSTLEDSGGIQTEGSCGLCGRRESESLYQKSE